jgi:inorganic pyrophosphatase
MAKRRDEHPALRLPPFDEESGALNAIVETPRGSRNKFSYDPESWLFRLTAVLPEGSAFPHAFGFVPSTLGDDGDPLDVMILMDEPVYPGVLVPARLIGVIRARQTDANGEVAQNDRLLAVSNDSRTHAKVRKPNDFSEDFVREVEQFFMFYNKARGRKFDPLGWSGPRAAAKQVAEGAARAEAARKKAK